MRSRILLFALIFACAMQAQTPYDSFAPEVTRPMLELEEPTAPQPDSENHGDRTNDTLNQRTVPCTFDENLKRIGD